MRKILFPAILLCAVLFTACTKEEPIVEDALTDEEIAINYLQNFVKQPILFQYTEVDEEKARAKGYFITKTGDVFSFQGKKNDFVGSVTAIAQERLNAIVRLGESKIGTVDIVELNQMYRTALNMPAVVVDYNFTASTSTLVNAYVPYSPPAMESQANGSNHCSAPEGYTESELRNTFDARIMLGEGRMQVANTAEAGVTITNWLKTVVDFDLAGDI